MIDSSEELGVSGPIHTNDGGRVHEGDGPVKRVFSLLVDLVNVDGVIMGSKSEVLLIWRVREALTPFSWLQEGSDSL